MAAMEAVCCDAELCEDVAFEALIELVDMHLVALVDVSGAEPRFRLLETVRRFAVKTLRNAGTADAVLERHATHFVSLAVRAGQDLEGPHERSSAALVNQELPNIRAALEHRSTVERPGAGLAAASALGPYWLDRGPLREGRDWIERFLDSPGGSARLRAVAEGWSARLAVEQGETAGTAEQLVRAREVVDRTGSLAEWLGLTDHLAASLRLQGRFDLADEYLVEAVARCRSADTAWVHAELLLSRAVVARDRGDPGRVGELVAEATRVARLAGHERVHARAMMNLALSDSSMADARAEVERAFQRCREIGDLRGAAMSAAVAAVLAIDDDDATAAATWFIACLDIGVAVGCWHAVAWGVAGVAGLAVRCERITEATRLYEAMRPYLGVIRQQTPPAWLARYDGMVDVLGDRLGDDVPRERGGADSWPVAVDLARQIAADLSSAPDPPRRAPQRRRGPRANPELTDRELDVLRELVVGRTNQKIADRLGLSAKTVMHHTGSVYRKLGVRGRAEAVAHALRLQLVAS
jgi:DNA-binding CsgD family transcriptional regulator